MVHVYHYIYLVPGPFCDMEDIECNQYFYEYDLPDVFTPDSGNVSMVTKVMNLLRDYKTSQTLNLVTQSSYLCRLFTRLYITA